MISKKYKTIVAQKGKPMWLTRESNVNSFIKVLKKNLKLKKKILVLDAGCANGRDSNELKENGLTVIGIDNNKRFIAEAKKDYPKIDFEIDNIEDMHFKSSYFDAVYCVNTLFYTKPKKSIPELLRVLKKGGLLFITLDEKIENLETSKEIHSLDIEKTLTLMDGLKLLNKKYIERIDIVPFKHKHYFYEMAFEK